MPDGLLPGSKSGFGRWSHSQEIRGSNHRKSCSQRIPQAFLAVCRRR